MAKLLPTVQAKCEKLSAGEVRQRFPELRFDDVTIGVLETESGVLMARQAVQTLAEQLVRNGVEVRAVAVLPPRGEAKLAAVKTSDGQSISAAAFVFACGSWLPKLFPDLLKDRIFPTRQEVFFFGPPAGRVDFNPPKIPPLFHHTPSHRPAALPNIENRGFKISLDTHGAE